ncbi:MAG: undecaprenyl-diphosphate phosphatase [Candidatus Omnitrophica bacterium]|nr:undecaprenyl-diphosphate phosphatase [Candidatus Omnitrophota bacterium]MCM8776930.1 undecaprenyl-diphosphate phosphatase [Candidatus Omnitrophota bacterium]
MALKDAFFLALVQGIAEWLPVSSSGHLAVLHHLFGLAGNVSFDIFLHLSSLFVIIIFFRKDISELIMVFLHKDFNSYNFKIILYILVATVITGIAGILLRQYLELISKSSLPYTFLFTTLLLFLSARKGENRIDIKRALFIGLLQGIALLPGVSRSGATISAAKITGVKDEDAFRFSFLLAVPAILAAVVYDIKDIDKIPFPFLLTGFFVSFFTGLGALYLLKKVVMRGRFYLFGFYTLFLSLVLFFIS